MKVTVLMPLYNGEKFLGPAVESILGQTFTDFELLIVCDPCTDRSIQVAESYKDPRIKLIRNSTRQGFVISMNSGLARARGEYIAMMDCDDLSLPHRLSKQVEFMDSNPHLGGCGSWVHVIGDGPRATWKYPTDPDEIACQMLFRMAFANPSVMLRRTMLDKFDIRYRQDYTSACDWEMLQRCTQRFPMSNIPEPLLLYRFSLLSRSHNDARGLKEAVKTICLHRLAQLSVDPTPQELMAHVELALPNPVVEKDVLTSVNSLLLKLRDVNQVARLYPEPAFAQRLCMEWFYACRKACHSGMWTWRTFRSSQIRDTEASTLMQLLLLTKCVIRWDDRPGKES